MALLHIPFQTRVRCRLIAKPRKKSKCQIRNEPCQIRNCCIYDSIAIPLAVPKLKKLFCNSTGFSHDSATSMAVRYGMYTRVDRNVQEFYFLKLVCQKGAQ